MKREGKLRLGTSAFTAAGWEGVFYPEGMAASEYLSHYAREFDCVEVDSTYYRVPSAQMVRGWYEKTPKGFLFAAKVPGTITHEKVLTDCDEEFRRFVDVMEGLGEKLGPLLLQFPYFNKKAFAGPEEFLERLEKFLKKLPREHRFAVEVRNKTWLGPRMLELLREHGVALALIDHPWMPRPREILARMDPVTADFTYVRWLGDRKGIEEQTKTWDKVIVDRRRELAEWVEAIRKFNQRSVDVFAFANNHFAGHAPATIRQFWELWKKAGGGDRRPGGTGRGG
jgi:uncharacterized protein YecE (DUF72 family)